MLDWIVGTSQLIYVLVTDFVKLRKNNKYEIEVCDARFYKGDTTYWDVDDRVVLELKIYNKTINTNKRDRAIDIKMYITDESQQVCAVNDVYKEVFDGYYEISLNLFRCFNRNRKDYEFYMGNTGNRGANLTIDSLALKDALYNSADIYIELVVDDKITSTHKLTTREIIKLRSMHKLL